MKKIILSSTFLIFSLTVFSQAFTSAEKINWAKQAKGIEIIKDNWGVPHIYTNTDADAVLKSNTIIKRQRIHFLNIRIG